MARKLYIIKAEIWSRNGMTTKFFGPVSSKKAADAAFLVILRKRNVVGCEIVEEENA